MLTTFKKSLFLSAVALALSVSVEGYNGAVVPGDPTYKAKRMLRLQAQDVAEEVMVDDSECGSLDMAEDSECGSLEMAEDSDCGSLEMAENSECGSLEMAESGDGNTDGSAMAQTPSTGGNTWTQAPSTSSGGDTQAPTMQSSGNSDDNKEYSGSKTDIDFSTLQDDINVGTVSPQ